MITKLKLNTILAIEYLANVFLNNMNITQFIIIKGISVINEFTTKKIALEFPVKILLVYFSAKTVKLFGDCSKIAQKNMVMKAKKVTAINFSRVVFEYCIIL